MFKLIRRAISLILAIIVIIPTYALFVTWNSAKNPHFRTSAEAIVVPGAAQLNGAPGEVLLARLTEAKRIKELYMIQEPLDIFTMDTTAGAGDGARVSGSTCLYGGQRRRRREGVAAHAIEPEVVPCADDRRAGRRRHEAAENV